MSGEFFAIGQPQWAKVCELGLNPAVAYLVQASGTGRDNCTTAWSAESVRQHAGMSWKRAKAAIDATIKAKVCRRVSSTPKPRYKLSLPKEADKLIWLPNEFVRRPDGLPSPVALLRQTQEIELLQTAVDLYGSHDLNEDGGLPRDLIWNEFEQEHIGDWGEFRIYGFHKCDSCTLNTHGPLKRFRNRPQDSDGYSWHRVGTLFSIGLLEWVDVLFEGKDGEPLHPLTGDEYAANVFNALISVELALPEWMQERAALCDHIVPILKHLSHATVISIARLRYRPKTSRTAEWFARHVTQCEHYAQHYGSLAARLRQSHADFQYPENRRAMRVDIKA